MFGNHPHRALRCSLRACWSLKRGASWDTIRSSSAETADDVSGDEKEETEPVPKQPSTETQAYF